jgi:hypothetical protein
MEYWPHFCFLSRNISYLQKIKQKLFRWQDQTVERHIALFGAAVSATVTFGNSDSEYRQWQLAVREPVRIDQFLEYTHRVAASRQARLGHLAACLADTAERLPVPEELLPTRSR